MRLTAFATAALSSAVALAGFAGVANASATVDLIWIDVTNTDADGNPICLQPANRNCPQIGTRITSVAVADDITLGVIITAGPNGILAVGVSVNYGDALQPLSVVDFGNLTTEPFLPLSFPLAANEPPFIDFINAYAVPALDMGIGLPAGVSAYLGTVTFRKDQTINGVFEFVVDTDGPGGLDDVLDLAGNVISSTTTFNSAFLTELAPPHTPTPTPTATPTGTPSPGLPTGTPSATPTPGPPTPTPTATPTFTPTATPTPTPTSPFPEDCHPICRVDKKCSVGGSAPQDSCVASVGEEVTYTYDVEMGPVGVVFEVRDDKLGVIGQTSGERLTRTTTLTQTTTNTASVSVYSPGECFCLGDTPDSVTVTVVTPTPTPTLTPTMTPTETPATPTPSATPTAGPAGSCRCEVRNIFPGGTVANLRNVSSGGQGSTQPKAVGAEFAAVDNQGSNSCSDENPGTLFAQAEATFHIEDESGNVILDRTKTITCINGVDNPEKFTLVFGPESCGPGGGNVGVFDIFSSVSGEAGTNSKTQRIRCR